MAEQVTLESLQEQIAKQNEIITSLLKSQTAATEEKPKTPSIPKEPVKIDGKEYRWNVASFSFAGSAEKITAEEASVDKQILAKILKIVGQGLLKELV